MYLTNKELQKGITAFSKLKTDSEEKLSNLKSELLKEASARGFTNYSHNLLYSIKLETDHLNITIANISNYQSRLN